MDTLPPHDLDRLLADTAFVRRLARSLVRDPDAAEDLAQDALVVALERPPRTGISLRGWIASVVRSLAIDRARSTEARSRRESAVVKRRHSPGADEIAERIDLSQHVVRALRELDEPYRTALYLRYVEELDPSDIAERLELPVATVKTRLRRGLEILRARFDREWGERATWSALFVPLALDSTTKATIAGTIWMSTLTKAAAVLCVCAAAWMLWPSDPSVSPVAGPTFALDARGELAAPRADETARTAVTELAAGAEIAAATDRSSSSAGPFVHVIDDHRFPVADVHVALHVPGFGDDEATTDASGIARFVRLEGLESENRPVGILAWDARGRAGALGCMVRAIGDDMPADEIGEMRDLGEIVLGPGAGLTVRVERSGLPVSDASVWLEVGARRSLVWTATTDAEGRVRLARVPAKQIVARAESGGWAGRTTFIPAPGVDTELVVALQPARTIDVTVVESTTKMPIAGAQVRVSESFSVTEDEGIRGVGFGTTFGMSQSLGLAVPPTDATGRTRIVGLPFEGRYVASAKAEPFVGPRPPHGFPALGAGSEPIVLELSSIRERVVRWPLQPGEVHAPPSGTELTLRHERVSESAPDPSAALPTSARVENGAIVAEGVRDEMYICYAIAPDGSVARLQIRSNPADGAPTSFRRPRRIDVTVLDESGRPASGVRVEVRSEGNNLLLPRATTDSAGTAAFEGLWGWRTRVIANGYELATVDLEAGDAHVEGRLPSFEEASIRFRVDGEPRLPPVYRIWCGSGGRTVSEDPATGTVRMLFESDGQAHSLHITAPGFLTVDVPFDPDTGDVVDVDLRRGGALLARARPPHTGAMRLRVEAWDPVEERWRTGSAHQVRDERFTPNAPDEAYLYEGLAAGRYRVRDLGSDRASDAVDVIAGSDASVVDLDLSNLVLVCGVIERPLDRSPWHARVVVEGEGVAVHEPNGMKGSETPEGHYADKEGRFRVFVDVTRPVTLRVAHPYLSPDPKEGSVVLSGEMQDVRLKLVEGDEVQIPMIALGVHRESLRVYAYAGEPVGEPHAWFHALVIDGVARFSGLPHGAWTLWIDPNDSTAPIIVRDVVVGEGITLVDVAPAKGSTLRVRILHSEGVVIPHVYAVVRRKTEPITIRGRYSRGEDVLVVTGIEAGEFEVGLEGPDGREHLRTITFDGRTDVEIEFDAR